MTAVQVTAGDAETRAELRAEIAGALVVPDERGFAPHAWPQAPEVVALYFGADWCGPCHAFVPHLIEMRNQLRAAGVSTEVVYVSLDTSQRGMRRYMRRRSMPWPAIDYRRLEAMPALRALGGPAPPNLVLIDREGHVLASAWDGRRYSGLQPVLREWLAYATAHASGPEPSPPIPAVGNAPAD